MATTIDPRDYGIDIHTMERTPPITRQHAELQAAAIGVIKAFDRSETGRISIDMLRKIIALEDTLKEQGRGD